ncbi:MAG: hypothetical protein SFV15_17040 [Polyangiaceae bacterium]|nr:hypothetical protein [Polyangiaceae bacterium]
MPLEHVIYIPVILGLGFAVGYVVGMRAVRTEVAKAKKAAKE